MKGKLLPDLVLGFFAAVIASIVYVSAGAKGKMSGGQQTAAIVNAGGSATSNVAKALVQ
jgi:hypothetical protein